ncbi:MAG: hypothetical protein ACLRQK_03245 [Evtepia sp.]
MTKPIKRVTIKNKILDNPAKAIAAFPEFFPKTGICQGEGFCV